ncbi:MAG: P1 family peptidase [Actinomycetota bacterium]
MITDVPGVLVGSWTGEGTGVTVVLLPPGTVGSAEVRGGAPATRELALLEATRTVETVDAVVLSGGSAFGLATADGVMAHLETRDRGVPTRGGRVPIVPAAAIFDLTESGGTRPGPLEGRAAAEAAEAGHPLEIGRVGAGVGARVGTWRGGAHAAPGGLGSASARVGDATVGALVVVNAVGDVCAPDGTVIAGSRAPAGVPPFPEALHEREHTTLVCVATDARCTKSECFLLAQSAHHGLARAIHPSHTRFDGDLAVAVATGVLDAPVDRLRVAVTDVVAAAVRSAVRAG